MGDETMIIGHQPTDEQPEARSVSHEAEQEDRHYPKQDVDDHQ